MRGSAGAGIIVALVVAAAAPASAVAATKSCGEAKGVGYGIVVTNVKTTSGSCLSAKTVAKRFVRSGASPAGYACTEKSGGAKRSKVTCRGMGRTVSFKVNRTVSDSLSPEPQPALPQA